MKVKKTTWRLDREYKNLLRCWKGEISLFSSLDDKESLNYIIEFFCKDFSNTVSFISAEIEGNTTLSKSVFQKFEYFLS